MRLCRELNGAQTEFVPSEQAGFTMVELVVAITLLALVSIGFASTMGAASLAAKTTRAKTVAEELTTQRVERIRKMDYADVGLTTGNPHGTIVSPQTIAIGGYTLQVKTAVSYIDDQIPGGYRTYANYKRVKVTAALLALPNRILSSFDTVVAPPTAPGVNKGRHRFCWSTTTCRRRPRFPAPPSACRGGRTRR